MVIPGEPDQVAAASLTAVLERRGRRCILAVSGECIYQAEEHALQLEHCEDCGAWMHTACLGIPDPILQQHQGFTCCQELPPAFGSQL